MKSGSEWKSSGGGGGGGDYAAQQTSEEGGDYNWFAPLPCRSTEGENALKKSRKPE